MSEHAGSVGSGGHLGLTVIRRRAWLPEQLEWRVRGYRPQNRLGEIVRDILLFGLSAEQAQELLDQIADSISFSGRLALVVFRDPASPFASRGLVEDLGVVSERVVTTAGVNYLATQLKNQAAAVLNYHSLGTGTTAEATGDTGLVTEWAGADYTGGVRATGTQTNPSANVMRTVGTNTKASAGTSAVTEHGVNTVATVATATLWDRSVFSAVNLAQNDSLQATYDLTLTAGG